MTPVARVTPKASGPPPPPQTALLDPIRHHLAADVPVSAHLSAGVDSGARVGLMRDAGQQDSAATRTSSGLDSS